MSVKCIHKYIWFFSFFGTIERYLYVHFRFIQIARRNPISSTKSMQQPQQYCIRLPHYFNMISNFWRKKANIKRLSINRSTPIIRFSNRTKVQIWNNHNIIMQIDNVTSINTNHSIFHYRYFRLKLFATFEAENI